MFQICVSRYKHKLPSTARIALRTIKCKSTNYFKSKRVLDVFILETCQLPQNQSLYQNCPEIESVMSFKNVYLCEKEISEV